MARRLERLVKLTVAEEPEESNDIERSVIGWGEEVADHRVQ